VDCVVRVGREDGCYEGFVIGDVDFDEIVFQAVEFEDFKTGERMSPCIK
jgi:hypothetical protein